MAIRYWRTDGSGNWADNANWDDTSSSGAGGASYPTSSDDVIFDRAYSPAATCTLAATAACKSLTMTGASGITIAGSSNITVWGSVTIPASGVTWTQTENFIISASATITIQMTFDSIAGLIVAPPSIASTITLASNLNLGAKFLYVYGVNGGTIFDSANYQIDCATFGDNLSASARTLTLGTSTINCTAVSFGGGEASSLTVTDTTHTINISSNSATANNFAGKAWGIVNWKSNASAARAHAITFGSGASFVQFNIDQLTDRRDCSLSFSGDFSVSDSCTWKSGGTGNDNPTYRLLIKSSAVGTTRTVTVSAASKTLTITDVDLQDIKVADTNTPTVTLTRVGDCGGNTKTTGGGYIKNVSDPKTVYLDAGTDNANLYSNYWSTSSGGGSPSLNNYPLPQDTAVVDNATWDDTGNTLTINAGLRVGNIDASGLTEANTIVLQSATYYGDLNLSGSGLTVTSTSDTVTIDARVKNEASDTLDINRGGSIGSGSLTVNSYGSGSTVKLLSALTLTGTATLTRGDFDLNGQTLTTTIFSSSNSNTRELKDTAGGGKIIVNGLTGTIFDMSTTTGLTVSNAPDIDIGDSNKTLTADVTFAGGGQAFGDFTVTKHAGDFDCIIQGSNTFGTLTCETPDAGEGGTYKYSDLQLTAETDQDITSLVATGDATNTINLKSTSGGSAATLSDTTGTNTVSYCAIQDITAEGGATWDADDGTNTDGSGNTGWTWPVGGGYAHDVGGVAAASIGKVGGVAAASIGKVGGK